MARVTITLADERYERLKSRAASTHKTLSELVEEGLAEAEEAQMQRLAEFVAKARRHAARVEPNLSDEEVMTIAVEETRAYHREKAAGNNAARHS
jgi:predicted CopG family antitoxin